MSVAETYRAREVYRYYQPWDVDKPPATSHASRDEADLGCSSPQADNFKTQTSFSDTALTAFAQLIALRLKAQRAIVSLVDHENEYFLAESTSTLSSIDGAGPEHNAWLSISGASVPREASLCEQTLRLVPNTETEAGKTPFCFVPDLRIDGRMCKLDCVKTAPFLRFYCGVALTNQNGINIGCVYVVDEKPRNSFTLAEAQFLSTMAATVMDHLENIRAKEDIVRVTRMSQALHAFIEGDGTMDGDWARLKKYNLPAGAGVGYHWETNKATRNDRTRPYAGKKDQDVSVSTRTIPTIADVEGPTSPIRSPFQHAESTADVRFNFNGTPWSSASEEPVMRSVFDAMSDTANGNRDIELSNSGFSDLLHSTFSRASNLAREGMEVDGAVFFDAPFRFYQGRSTLESDSRLAEPLRAEADCESDDEDLQVPKFHLTPSPVKHRTSYFDVTETSPPRRMPTDSIPGGLKADVLGFSTRKSSSWDNQTMGPDTNFTAIDQSLLTSLVRHYPHGELFVYDENGPVTPSADVLTLNGSEVTVTPMVNEKRKRHEKRKRVDVVRLLAAFPGARQIFFVPLHDTTSGCFIGSFAWSTSATRIFTIENHLSYLVAFGHSVMSEVSRLNTLSADRAKGDFISNVSHELRSPLHGILASIEFLADTALDGFQRNLVDTVDICGRTLLDTIEHVLDFSKIKKFRQQSSQPLGVVADLDISAVIEEVLDAVFAGFKFNGLSSEGLADTTRSRTQNPERVTGDKSKDEDESLSSLPNELVTVILDIDFKEQWKFPTVPGTWRRLTMNLFGNALKHTPDGYIKVKLEARTIAPPIFRTNDNVGSTMVTLTISDSGRGMSTDFMKTKLFKPFSQEDPTAPGTGLGLSIVKQIVDLSAGEIDVRSEPGKGTEVRLSLPLDNCPPSPSDISSPSPDETGCIGADVICAVRRRAQGRKVTIRGFSRNVKQSGIQKEAAASLKASIEKYVTDWYSLGLDSDSTSPDILIAEESAFHNTSVTNTSFKLLLILCTNGGRRDIYTTRLRADQIVEFVSPPCGPHRLAKALLSCLDAEEAVRQTRSQRSSDIFKVTPATTSITQELLLPSHHEPIVKPQRRPRLTYRNSSRMVPMSSRAESPATDNSHRNSNTGSEVRSSAATSQGSGESPGKEDVPETETGKAPTALGDEGEITTRRPKMLLVEDNPVNMMLLSTYMKKNGWEYEKATNGQLALEAFQNRPQGFDVIFMDVSMPIMTGYESTTAIRAVEAERRQAYYRQQQLLSQKQAQSHSAIVSPLPVVAGTSPLQNGSLDTIIPVAPIPVVIAVPVPVPVPVAVMDKTRLLPGNTLPLLTLPIGSTPQSLTSSLQLPPTPLATTPLPLQVLNAPSSPSFPFPIAVLKPRPLTLPSNLLPPSTLNPLSALTSKLHQPGTPLLQDNAPALIIALTGFSSQLDQEMAFEAGMDIFMTKPVRFREVGRVLEGWKGR